MIAPLGILCHINGANYGANLEKAGGSDEK
jgi:hypothetical protein